MYPCKPSNNAKYHFLLPETKYHYTSEVYIAKKLDDPKTGVLAIIPDGGLKQNIWTLGPTFAKAYPTEMKIENVKTEELDLEF